MTLDVVAAASRRDPALSNTSFASKRLAISAACLTASSAVADPSVPTATTIPRFKTWARPRAYHGSVGTAEIKLLSGDVFTVEGTLEEVERKLSDAARSGQSRLAWFTEHDTDGRIGVNPAHVATLKVSEIAD